MGTTLCSTALGVLPLTAASAIVTAVAATVPGRSTAGTGGAASTAFALAPAGGAGWQ